MAAGEELDLAASWTIVSPDRTVRASIALADRAGTAGFPPGRRLYYTVEVREGETYTTVLETSPLGIARNDESFIDGLTLVTAGGGTRVDETYQMTTGKRLAPRNFANQRILTFSNPRGARLESRAARVRRGLCISLPFSGSRRDAAYHHRGNQWLSRAGPQPGVALAL